MSEVIFAVLICLWVYLSHQYSQLQAKTAVLETKLASVEKVASKIVEINSSDVEPGIYFPRTDPVSGETSYVKDIPKALDILYGKQSSVPNFSQEQIFEEILKQT